MLLLNETYEQEIMIFENISAISMADINMMPCIEFDVYYYKALKLMREKYPESKENDSNIGKMFT